MNRALRPAHDGERTPLPAWRAVLRCEWTLLRRDGGVWLAVLLMAACVAYAHLAGVQRAAERSAAVAAAQRDETDRRATLLRQAQRIERGEIAPPTESFRDPTHPLSVGRGAGATLAHLAPAPLATTAVGMSDLYPSVFRVSAGSRDRFLFVDELANPLLLAAGSFDLAFVVVVLLPLVLLALSYDVLSAEREQGTWALTLASSAPPAQVLVVKLLVRCAPVLVVLLGGTALALAASGARLDRFDGAPALACWAGLVVLYAGLWLALALAVNALGRDSAFNAVALVLAWVLLVLVAPAAVNALAEALHPAPARSEMVQAVRQAAIDVDRDAEQARFRAEHGMAQPGDAARRDRRALALLRAADQRADAVLARHDSAVAANQRLAERLAVVSPPMLLNDALAALAGNGRDRWDAHLADVAAFHKVWQDFFVGYAERGAKLTSVDQAAMPRFERSAASTWVGSVAWRVAATAALLAGATVVILAWAIRRLRAQA